ncbi:hypothetical protein PG987_000200 [Apiospora arundinis]
MNIVSWLEGIEPQASIHDSDRAPELPKTRKRKRQQMPTPSTSTPDPNPSESVPSNKRARPEENSDGNGQDTERTPRGKFRAWSSSDRTGSPSSRSSHSSRASPSKRMSRLELASDPVIKEQISFADNRMPAELKDMLAALGNFARASVVPVYLESAINERKAWDSNLYNFYPNVYQTSSTDDATVEKAAALDPKLYLHQVMQVFAAAKECFTEDHSEAGWNSEVHCHVFRLGLGTIADDVRAPTEEQDYQTRVRAMLCTAAKLKGHQRGAKMVDFCLFVEPQNEDYAKVEELRARDGLECSVNHTDYNPLRRRPIVLSAESKRSGEEWNHAQVQLGVWQAAQWSLLQRLARTPLIPFLPALIIHGHEWSFAATSKHGKQTVPLHEPWAGTVPLPCTKPLSPLDKTTADASRFGVLWL